MAAGRYFLLLGISLCYVCLVGVFITLFLELLNNGEAWPRQRLT